MAKRERRCRCGNCDWCLRYGDPYAEAQARGRSRREAAAMDGDNLNPEVIARMDREEAEFNRIRDLYGAYRSSVVTSGFGTGR